jgi:hypothetical protein
MPVGRQDDIGGIADDRDFAQGLGRLRGGWIDQQEKQNEGQEKRRFSGHKKPQSIFRHYSALSMCLTISLKGVLCRIVHMALPSLFSKNNPIAGGQVDLHHTIFDCGAALAIILLPPKENARTTQLCQEGL